MKKKKLYQAVFSLTSLLLFIIITSSTELIGDAQTSSQKMTYAYVTNGRDDTVSVIDTATNSVTAEVPVGGYPTNVAVTPDGTKVYVTNRDNTVSVIDTSTNKVTATMSVGGDSPWGVAVSPDGTKVYVTNYNDSSPGLAVIDTATNSVTAEVSVGGYPNSVAVTPDGKKVYVSPWMDSHLANLYIIDTATNNVSATNVVSPNLKAYFFSRIAFNPMGTKAYAANMGYAKRGGAYIDAKNISVIDTATNTVTATVPVGDQLGGVAVTPDGTKVYVTHSIGTVSVIGTATNSVTDRVILDPDGSGPGGPVAVTPDGTKVYVASNNNIYVIDTAINRVIGTVSGFSGGGSDIVISSPPVVPNAETKPTEQPQPATTEKTQPTTMEQAQTTITEQQQYTPTEQTKPSSASINLYGEKTNVNVGEDVLLKLSAVNLITKPTMHVQVIIIPPSGMSVSSSEFVESGAGQYTTIYDLEPGKGKDIEVRIKANQVGNFDVKGRVVYYFGENKQDAEDYTFNLPIQVEKVSDTPDSQLTPVPTSTSTATHTFNITPGFGVASLVFMLMIVFILRRN